MSMIGKEKPGTAPCGRLASHALSSAGLAFALALTGCVQGEGLSSITGNTTQEAPAMMTRIVGTLAIRERIALPDNAYAMVEVRNSAGTDAMPIVFEQKVEMGGRQPPVAFDFAVDRMRLPMDIGLAFRGAIFVEGKPRFVSDPLPLDLTQERLDLGMVILKAYQSAPFGVMDPATARARLLEREWIVEDLDGGGIIDSSRISLTFAGDERVSGIASCNRYSGSWTANGMALAFGPAAVTRMACAPALMMQEAKFLEILGAAATFGFSDTGALVIETADGRTMLAREAG